jgi:formylglycine-generating enzyme required for sulfatase activity
MIGGCHTSYLVKLFHCYSTGPALPRLFISHSNKDSIHALAFQRWLELKGWSKDDVFIDLHDMQAGERWRETLVKANVACEALLYLASPEALDSEECKREVRRAEDDRKDVIVAILRDVQLDDPRLKPWTDRQIIDLSTNPREERVEVEHRGQRHLIDFNRAALNAIHAKLIDWGIAPDAFAWPPRHNPKALPYPGLDAFDEYSAGIFFGREADVMAGIRDLRQIRHRGSPRLLVIQAASGAGKSSFLRAGLWPRLGRTAEFVPLAVVRPATGIITGQHGLGQGLSQWFGERRRQAAPGTIHAELMAGDAAAGAQQLAAHMSAAVALVAKDRALNLAEGQAPSRLSPLIAIDQGEELFAAEDAAQSNRFLDMMGHLLGSPPAGLDPYVLVTIRADSVDALLQRMPTLGLVTPHTIMLPPLSLAAYRDVITKPAAVYTRQVVRLDLEPELVEALVKGASGADALPLLAFTLQRLFLDFAPEQTLTKAHYDAMGGIEGSIDRKLAEAKTKAGTPGTDVNLRRLIVPALATWDAAANAAKRLVPNEADVIAGDRAGLSPLAHALVEARLLTRGGGTLEVAHEALLRRQPISGWLEQQKDALRLRDDVLREAEEWRGGGRHAESLVRRGKRLRAALALATSEDFKSALARADEYLKACRKRTRRMQALVGALMVLLALGGVGWWNEEFLGEQYHRGEAFLQEKYYWRLIMGPSVLTVAQEKEKAAKPGSEFNECMTGCPTMVVAPAGKFMMGSPESEKERDENEGPQHEVMIAKPFAIGKTEVTFAEWDACVDAGACTKAADSDSNFGRGNRPVINVSWDDTQQYIAWLSRVTGKDYRLMSEAEWEYAARAGTTTTYSWGDDIGKGNANCNGCGSPWDFEQTAPVASFKPNDFGLYDMHGNVYEWVEDPWHNNYSGAPVDGSAWLAGGDASVRVARGGSWYVNPQFLRAAKRSRWPPGFRVIYLGFRLARTLNP